MKKSKKYISGYSAYFFALLLILLSTGAFGKNKAIPWLQLLLDDERPEEVVMEIGPEGGTLKLPKGVILDIPPGAVAETTTIKLTDLPCDQVDPILSARDYASHEKRCLGGFSAEPDGLVFNVLISAIVPVPMLGPGEIPVLTEVDLDEQKYWIAPTDLVYRGDEKLVEIKIQHLSIYGVAGLMSNTVVAGNASKELSGLTGEVTVEQMANSLPDCLNQYPTPPGSCCTTFHVRSEAVDFAAGDCQIVGDDIQVTYPLCPGAPTFTHSVSETSAGCPEDMTFEVKITPQPLTLYACEERQLKATITGKSEDGKKTLFSDAALDPIWESENPAFAFVRHDGVAKGEVVSRDEMVTIKALVSHSSDIEGSTQVTVKTLTGTTFFGRWQGSARGCQDPEDNGPGSGSGSILIDGQIGPSFTAHVVGYNIQLSGTISRQGSWDCRVTNGQAGYTICEWDDDEDGICCIEYCSSGDASFSGTLTGEMKLNLNVNYWDTSGDTCSGSGSISFTKN